MTLAVLTYLVMHEAMRLWSISVAVPYSTLASDVHLHCYNSKQ